MSIISNTHKYIFIHIPKTGGTTITSGLSVFNTPIDIELGGTAFGEKIAPLYVEKYKIGKHTTAQKLKTVIGEDTFSKFFTFAFVRNPYDRILSIYSFLKSWRNWPKNKVMDDFSDVKEFLKSDFFLNEGGPSNILKPQYTWVTDNAQRIVIDQVYKLEDFGDHSAALLDRIGIKVEDPKLVFRTLNTSKKDNRDIEIIHRDEEIKGLILKKYKEDFKLFNYPE